METIVKATDGTTTQTYVGKTICEGPGCYRLVLTRPYHEAGRIAEIPRSRIESITEVQSGPLGTDPTPS